MSTQPTGHYKSEEEGHGHLIDKALDLGVWFSSPTCLEETEMDAFYSEASEKSDDRQLVITKHTIHLEIDIEEWHGVDDPEERGFTVEEVRLEGHKMESDPASVDGSTWHILYVPAREGNWGVDQSLDLVNEIS